MIRLFWHITRLAFQQQLTYRSAMLAGLVTNLFFGLLRAFVLVALYQEQHSVNGMTLQAAITYVAFSQAMIAFLWIFGSWDVMNSVMSGAVGADLLRPMPLFLLWMARDAGRALVNLLARGVLLLVIYAAFFTIHIPTRFEQWLGLAVALVLGWLVSYAWRFLVNLTAFWSPDARGFGRVAFTVSQLFSGFLMPLRLYPDWFAQICALTPFPALFNGAVEIYLGILTGPAMWQTILGQLVWFGVLAAAAQLVLRAGLRRLVIQGG